MSQQPIPAPFSRLASATDTGLMTSAHYTKLDALMSQAALTAALATIPTTTAALPDSTDKRYVTDAQRTVLGNTSGANTGDVTVSSPAGWLSRTGQALTFALVAAGAAVDGVVNQVAQSFKGAKTFIDAVIISAGLTLNGSVNQMMKVTPPSTVSGQGFATPTMWFELTALNQTNLIQFGSGLTSTTWEMAIGYYGAAGAPIISSRAGPIIMGLASGTALIPLAPGVNGLGTNTNYWGRAHLSDGITFWGDVQTIIKWDAGGANHWEMRARPNFNWELGNNSVTYMGCRIADGFCFTNFGFEVNPTGSQATVKSGAGNGTRIDQRGLDRRGVVVGNDSPGAQCMGINRFAAGQTTCAITTSQAGLASHVEITWLSDPGARDWVTLGAGVFTVNLSAAPAGNVDFSWRVSGLL